MNSTTTIDRKIEATRRNMVDIVDAVIDRAGAAAAARMIDDLDPRERVATTLALQIYGPATWDTVKIHLAVWNN